MAAGRPVKRMVPVRNLIGRAILHPALSLGSTVLWGLLELVALQRSRLGSPGARDKRRVH